MLLLESARNSQPLLVMERGPPLAACTTVFPGQVPDLVDQTGQSLNDVFWFFEGIGVKRSGVEWSAVFSS